MILSVLNLHTSLVTQFNIELAELTHNAPEGLPSPEEMETLMLNLKNHYFELTGGDYEAILKDASDLINRIKKEDLEEAIKDIDFKKAFEYIVKNVIDMPIAALEYYGLDKQSLFLKAEEAAAQWYEKPRYFTAKKVLGIDYPIDKVNNNIWNILAGAEKNGQLQINFNVAKHNSGKQATVLYSINFDNLGADLKITKTLTPFDKRVMVAVAALYNAGNEVISITQIFEKMGNTGKPNANQIKKINDSLEKLQAAHIFLSNNAGEDAETDTYPKKAVSFEYSGSLLPMERVNAYINGQLAESAVRPFREPPVISFARGRHQITTLDPKLLQSPLNKTDQNLMIDDYLIDRIAKMKRAKANHKQVIAKILFSSLNESCKRTTSKQRQRTPETVFKYLDHYKSCDFISGYTKESDGVVINL